MRRRAVALLLFALTGHAQPAIAQNGVVNSASRIPPSLAGGAIARGAQFTVYGVRFGSRGHTRVTIFAAGKSIDAGVLSATDGRIEARMPETAPLGHGSLIVTVDGRSSAAFPFEIAASNPGLFSRNGEGWGPGRIENIAPDSSRSENSLSTPARPGERVAIFGTGFGNAKTVRLLVAGRVVDVPRRSSDGRLEFRLPETTPQGCFVPVTVLVSPQRASNVVTVSVHRGLGACKPNVLPAPERGSLALGILARTRMMFRSGSGETITDDGRLALTKIDHPLPSPFLLLPPAASCTAYAGTFQAETVLPTSIGAALATLGGRGLDGGSQVTLRRGSDKRVLRRDHRFEGYYQARLGQAGEGASRRAPPLFLDPGEIEMEATGGRDAGRFDLRVDSPAAFEWLNRDALASIDRRRPLEVRWRGAPADRLMVIAATNVDQTTTATGVCLCAAQASAGKFTIPASMLANLPASQETSGIPYDQLYVVAFGPAVRLRAVGVDSGTVVSLYAIGRFVRFN